MDKIYYASCPECGVLSVVEDPGAERAKLQCFGCRARFTVEKDLLRTLDEIVDDEEGDEKPPPA